MGPEVAARLAARGGAGAQGGAEGSQWVGGRGGIDGFIAGQGPMRGSDGTLEVPPLLRLRCCARLLCCCRATRCSCPLFPCSCPVPRAPCTGGEVSVRSDAVDVAAAGAGGSGVQLAGGGTGVVVQVGGGGTGGCTAWGCDLSASAIVDASRRACAGFSCAGGPVCGGAVGVVSCLGRPVAA